LQVAEGLLVRGEALRGGRLAEVLSLDDVA
jgi:hypothetical protein